MKNRVEIREDHAVLFVNKSDGRKLEVKVSVKSLPLLDEYPNAWCFQNGGYITGKVVKNRVRQNFKIHRFLMGSPCGLEIDHINGDKLDNRLENLRIVTHSQNSQNQVINQNNKSGVRGVFWSKAHKKWRAQVRHLGKRHEVGLFNNIAEADSAVRAARRKLLPYSVG